MAPVPPKTVRRDLGVLGNAGFRLKEMTGDRGLKRCRIEGFEQQFAFTITDLLSVYMGRRFLGPLAGTNYVTGDLKPGPVIEPDLQHLRKIESKRQVP